jgi:two-component system cell cycle response regulator
VRSKGAFLSENRKLGQYTSEESDERTAIVGLSELRGPRKPQPRDRHLLVRVRGSHLGQVTRLPPEPLRVGRSQECELWLGDDGVSRRHARIYPQGGLYVVEDTESANGTFVQQQRVSRQILQDGDVIQFGPSAVFRYSISDENQEALLRQLYEASVTDALTGAHNREHFDAQLHAELSYARRHKSEVSLVLFDVDHFKQVNDTYGHPAGDNVLIEIAGAIGKITRNEDVFARYGGEEFALILRGIDGEGAHSVAERLRETIGALTVQSERGPIRVTISAGSASLAALDDKTPEALIAAADRRLYAAKRAGRNQVKSDD